MAQVIVSFGKFTAPGLYAGAQVYESGGQVEELSSGGASVASTITANEGDVCVVTNPAAGLIWVKFDAAPTAAVEDLHPVMGASQRIFGPIGAGMKVAVIDDS